MWTSFPSSLGGPVLGWELLRGSRLRWNHLCYSLYTLWLLVLVLGFIVWYFFDDLTTMGGMSVRTPYRDSIAWRLLRQSGQLEKFLFFLLNQQIVIVLLLTPAFTAGAMGREKEQGTLLAWFTTELSAFQIVIGKLLARLLHLYSLLIQPVPVLVLLSVLADVPIWRVGLAMVQAAILSFTLASFCLLVAIWTRRITDAILASYASMVLVTIALLTTFGDTTIPPWLNLFTALNSLRSDAIPDWSVFWTQSTLALIAGVGCLLLAISRLRRTVLAQDEKRPGRRLWAYRPRIGNDPIRWRERYVLGLAPLPWLRGIPSWLGVFAIFCLSAILSVTALDALTPGFMEALKQGEWIELWHMLNDISRPERIQGEVWTLGIVLLFLGGLTMAVRCGNSISEEKRRKTWEDLILTGISVEDIAKSKVRGIYLAILPHLFAYYLPMFVLAYSGGRQCIVLATSIVMVEAGLFYVLGHLFAEIISAAASEDDTIVRPRVKRKALDELPILEADFPLNFQEEE
jgi:ABC-type transport system involved in multi-copper enzyme maturation permease subunit